MTPRIEIALATEPTQRTDGYLYIPHTAAAKRAEREIAFWLAEAHLKDLGEAAKYVECVRLSFVQDHYPGHLNLVIEVELKLPSGNVVTYDYQQSLSGAIARSKKHMRQYVLTTLMRTFNETAWRQYRRESEQLDELKSALPPQYLPDIF